ncbi:3,4-dihydroxy-2-butanone-4-phosphate synthase [Halobacteriales archaeon SW_7_68_16]|nr:MAG: 3,4-dihydroxy-2-butanone-4-phosphate synthase [Halobacteriales archaeon SW_7_68_16]
MSRTDTDIAAAIDAFRAGEPVLIHDAADREGEVDLIYPAGAVDRMAIARLRHDAGGLICVALSDAVCRTFELPFAGDAIDHPAVDDTDLGYDERSSFSLSVNHRDTYTGITDDDRALTIRELAAAAADPGETDFAATFRSPGHVRLLRGAPELLADRRGHTELGLALAAAAGRPPAVVVCEMLDAATGDGLAPTGARAYGERTDTPYVEGRRLIEAL